MEIIKLDTMRGKKVTVARIRMNIDLLSSLILHSGTPSIDTFDKLRVQDVDYAVIEPLREDIKGFLHKISKLDSLSEIEINKLARVANSLLEKKVVIIDLKGMKIGAARKFTTNLIMQKVKYSRCKIFKRNDFLMLFNFVEYTKDLLIEIRESYLRARNKHSRTS